MNKKVKTKELKLEKLKIAKLSNLSNIKGGANEEEPYTENSTERPSPSLESSCATVIGSTQTINQGPTRN